jgi:hypothetical protein
VAGAWARARGEEGGAGGWRADGRCSHGELSGCRRQFPHTPRPLPLPVFLPSPALLFCGESDNPRPLNCASLSDGVGAAGHVQHGGGGAARCPGRLLAGHPREGEHLPMPLLQVQGYVSCWRWRGWAATHDRSILTMLCGRCTISPRSWTTIPEATTCFCRPPVWFSHQVSLNWPGR